VERAVVKLTKTGGRGVLTAGGYILTAAHCIEWDHERSALLGDPCFQQIETFDGRKLVADVLAIERVADVALLAAPDGQQLFDECNAFEEWAEATKPVFGINPHIKPFADPFPVLVLNLNMKWVKGEAFVFEDHQPTISIKTGVLIESGASGGPVVDLAGQLIGLISQSNETIGRGEKQDCIATQFGNSLPLWAVRKLGRAQSARFSS
jgi:S1-C subfamily serine protease